MIETRQAGDDLRRRRECPVCNTRFTTYERVEHQPLRIIKNNGSRELYNHNKLRHGIILACEKRPVTDQQISQMIARVEKNLRAIGETEVPSSIIGDLVMKELKLLDSVAYIRFASVYKKFTDVTSFEQEIKILTQGN